MSSAKNTPVYHAFHVKDEFWTKIGAAWNTKSGKALSVQLELLPPDGRFTLVPPRKQDAPADALDAASQ